MKTRISVMLLMFAAMLIFNSCSGERVSDLQLDGDCLVNRLLLDSYEGTADLPARTITVRVPETCDVSGMSITALEISEGATSGLKTGDVLNMTVPHVMRVQHGDVYIDWTVRVVRDEAKILSFKVNGIYNGVIDEVNKTISVSVPGSLDLHAITPTIKCSENATISPGDGVVTDFTSPVTYTVTNNTASAAYRVTVSAIGRPSAVFVGLAATMDGLNAEEQTACKWMLQNISNSLYASFDDIKNGSVDLSDCKVIWWHYHKDGGIDGKEAFRSAAPGAQHAAVVLREYCNRGGALLLTRYATNLASEIGVVANNAVPNNCWGQFEADAEKVSGPWNFFIQGHLNHPLYHSLKMKDGEPNAVYTCDAGYRITNSTAQWHIGADWGGYADYDTWRSKTGAVDIAYGGDGAVVAWEFPAQGGRGGVLCIGSGCYDWYSVDEVPSYYHDNVAAMTRNAFYYLMKK